MVPMVHHSVAEEVLPDPSPGKGFVRLVSVASKMLIREVEQMSQGENPFTPLSTSARSLFLLLRDRGSNCNGSVQRQVHLRCTFSNLLMSFWSQGFHTELLVLRIGLTEINHSLGECV